MGGVSVSILPGLCVKDSSHGPDVMRGEEVELFGLLNLVDGLCEGTKFIVLAGRHSKWVKLVNGQVVDFFTSMSGELFDGLREKGLLASLLKKDPTLDEAFVEGVLATKKQTVGLCRDLFGVRAKVTTGQLDKQHTSSYAQGFILGAEIGDAILQFPELVGQAPVPIVGKQEFVDTYLYALKQYSIDGASINSEIAVVKGFSLYHSAYASEVVS